MFMNLNTGICNIKKSLKQYNQERSILLFFVQRTKYSNASVKSYNFIFNLFFLRINKHNPTHPRAYKAADILHTQYLILAVCTVITVPKEKWGEGRQQRLFKVSLPTIPCLKHSGFLFSLSLFLLLAKIITPS